MRPQRFLQLLIAWAIGLAGAVVVALYGAGYVLTFYFPGHDPIANRNVREVLALLIAAGVCGLFVSYRIFFPKSR